MRVAGIQKPPVDINEKKGKRGKARLLKERDGGYTPL